MPTKNTKNTVKKLPTLKASFTPPHFERHKLENSQLNQNHIYPVDQAEKEIGQLSLDVYDSPTELIIIAPIAGVKLDDINLSITEDILTVSGKRHLEFSGAADDYIIQECFWGEFSRSIVLPDNVDSGRISASFKDGVLRISIPKNPSSDSKTKMIKIKST